MHVTDSVVAVVQSQNPHSDQGTGLSINQTSSPMYDIPRLNRQTMDRLLDCFFGPNKQQWENSPPLTFSLSDQGLLCPETLFESSVEAQATKDKDKGILLDHNSTFKNFQNSLKHIITRPKSNDIP